MAGTTRSGRKRWSARLRLSAVLALSTAIALTSLPLSSIEAEAQQRPRSVLEMLFGNGSRAIEPQRRVVRPQIRKRRAVRQRPARQAPRRQAAPSAAAVAPPAAVAKSETAEKILVVGDFLAQGLADGLSDIYSERPDVVVKARVNGSSGLVREDFYDWTETLGPIIEEEKPAVVAMMVGSNDRQTMSTSGASASFRSEGWTAEYGKRIAAIAAIAKSRNVPLVWVGMPSFKFDRMSEDMVFLNDLYRKSASSAAVDYVDIWDGFVDADDNFVYSGPGVSGQTVRLRNSDGITMTDAGEDKLGFFAEKAIGRFLKNSGRGLDVTPLSNDQLSNIQLPPIGNAANAVTTAPVSLGDPSLDGGDTLLGGNTAMKGLTLETSPRDRLVLNGNGTGGVSGRADDFAWTEKSRSVNPEGPPIAFRGSVDLNAVRASSGIEPPPEMPGILDAIIEQWNAEKPPATPSDAPTAGKAAPAEAGRAD